MDNSIAHVATPSQAAPVAEGEAGRTIGHRVIRRNGQVTDFNPSKISVAMSKAFLAVEGERAADSRRIHETVEELTHQVVTALTRRSPEGGTLHIEDIQDQVELALMRAGHHQVARAYVLYREEHARLRAAREQEAVPAAEPILHVTRADGEREPLDLEQLRAVISEACQGLDGVDPEAVLTETRRSLYDGVTEAEIAQALTLAARSLVEREPNYTYVAARLLLDELRGEVLSHFHEEGSSEGRFGALHRVGSGEMAERYPEVLNLYIERGVAIGTLDPRLAEFDLDRLGTALRSERDLQFTYLGLQTLYDRYFLQEEGRRLELPQTFFMRIAMGLALLEDERESRAIAFYELLSNFDFMSSTPTLFNSGTTRSQLSSCYLTTVGDHLDGIYSAIRDNALLQKYAGGLGNDWTRVRALGAHIRGTNGKSQGVVPFLKVVNDTAIAVNQGGRRPGAVCAYLEAWHLDIEEFLELKKNTGDERRRTPDMNTANWIPDLFMKRVMADGTWTLFSPDEVPDLHDRFGTDFERAYEAYEAAAERGEIKNYKQISAVSLWRKMLSLLFETGHPWVTFKDPANLRSPQQHCGVVHSSNLCTEITLNTSDDEVAVCNLGSVNLANHITTTGELNHAKLRRTVSTAMRMLDNVIDINYYSVPQAERSNLRHRPVGLGLMGFADALFKKRLPYSSWEAVEFADRSMEAVSYYAIEASTELAAERGIYETFEGSLWSQGILPLDSLALLAEQRAFAYSEGQGYLEVDRSQTFDWDALRSRVKRGMRNSNCMAIAPTATIANICGVSPSIEPTYQNLYVKSNLSGEFTVLNPYLVHDLKAAGLWDPVMVNDLKYFDGSVAPIDRVPAEFKALYACAFEIDSQWLVEAAARRQKWIDQAQSLNLYVAHTSGPRLDALYRLAWQRGLKTTYYLRTLGATHVEKSTIGGDQLNAVQLGSASHSGEGGASEICSIEPEDCEGCQ